MKPEDEIQALRAKNARLREAVQNYHGLVDTPHGRRVLRSPIAEEAREIAREILGGPGGTTDYAGPAPETYYSALNEHPSYPYEDWQYEVDNGDTSRGYDEWVKACITRGTEELFKPVQEPAPGG